MTEGAIERLRLRSVLLRLANDLRLIIVIYLVSLVVAAALFSFCEHKSFGDGLWWSDVTALTIGYGDISPTTLAGRITASVFQHFWVYGIGPLVIVNFVIRVQRDNDQFSNDEQRWMMEAIQAIAIALAVNLPSRPSDTEHGNVVEE